MKKIEVYAIIPIRELENTKLRLRSLLSRSQREQLTFSMLSHVLSILEESAVVNVVLVCSKKQARLTDLKKRFSKVQIVLERNHHGGVNRAVEDGIQYLLENFQRVDSILIIPSDLPLFSTVALTLAISKLDSFDLIIGPSLKRDGTNLLLFNLPRGKIPFYYDDDSYRKHLIFARSHNLRYNIMKQYSISFDVDSSADFQKLRSLAKAKSFGELLRAIELGSSFGK